MVNCRRSVISNVPPKVVVSIVFLFYVRTCPNVMTDERLTFPSAGVLLRALCDHTGQRNASRSTTFWFCTKPVFLSLCRIFWYIGPVFFFIGLIVFVIAYASLCKGIDSDPDYYY